MRCIDACLAQLAERQTFNLVVVGSSPTAGDVGRLLFCMRGVRWVIVCAVVYYFISNTLFICTIKSMLLFISIRIDPHVLFMHLLVSRVMHLRKMDSVLSCRLRAHVFHSSHQNHNYFDVWISKLRNHTIEKKDFCSMRRSQLLASTSGK